MPTTATSRRCGPSITNGGKNEPVVSASMVPVVGGRLLKAKGNPLAAGCPFFWSSPVTRAEMKQRQAPKESWGTGYMEVTF